MATAVQSSTAMPRAVSRVRGQAGLRKRDRLDSSVTVLSEIYVLAMTISTHHP